MLFSRESTICHREPQELMTAFRLMLSGVIWFSSAAVQHSVTPLDSCWFQFQPLGLVAHNDKYRKQRCKQSFKKRSKCKRKILSWSSAKQAPFAIRRLNMHVHSRRKNANMHSDQTKHARSLEYLQIARVVIIIYHVVDPLHFTDHIKMKALHMLNMLSFFAFYLGTGRQTAPVESDVRPFSQALMAALKAMRPVRPVPSSPSRPLRRFRSFRSFKNVKSS